MPPADDSLTRSGSTSVRGRVRSPHISGGRPVAGSQRADSLGSCAMQPACYSLGWDRQTDGSQRCLMPPSYDGGHHNVDIPAAEGGITLSTTLLTFHVPSVL